MPVTGKLSKLVYDRLGDQVANELVDWFNAIDAVYRSDLRELNDVNFTKFDAKLEQRIVELRAELGARVDRLDAKMQVEMHQGFADVRVELAKSIRETKNTLFWWMFGLWLGNILATGCLLLAFVRAIRP